jgi:hypothetical protein
MYVNVHACIVRWRYWQPLHLDGPSRPSLLYGIHAGTHQEKIHLLENGLKALKTAFERSKSSQAV